MMQSIEPLYRVLLLFVSLILLTACDPPLWCQDPCANSDERRNAFCECEKPETIDGTTKPPQQSGGNQTPKVDATAGCICQYHDGTIGAWFGNKPSVFNNFKTLTIGASTCQNLSLCEKIRNGDTESYTYLTGRIRVVPGTWTEQTNLLTGGKIYVLFGSQSTSSQDPIQFKRTQLAAAAWSLANRASRAISKVDFEATVDSCLSACQAGSPYCLRDTTAGNAAVGLQYLYSELLKQDTIISGTDLSSNFGIARDPCNRSETIVNGGRVRNTGLTCTIHQEFPEAAAAVEILVPSVINGALSVRSDNIVKVDFDTPGSQPRLGITNGFLNDDWGGEIKSLYGNADFIGAVVGRQSCLMLELPH